MSQRISRMKYLVDGEPKRTVRLDGYSKQLLDSLDHLIELLYIHMNPILLKAIELILLNDPASKLEWVKKWGKLPDNDETPEEMFQTNGDMLKKLLTSAMEDRYQSFEEFGLSGLFEEKDIEFSYTMTEYTPLIKQAYTPNAKVKERLITKTFQDTELVYTRNPDPNFKFKIGISIAGDINLFAVFKSVKFKEAIEITVESNLFAQTLLVLQEKPITAPDNALLKVHKYPLPL